MREAVRIGLIIVACLMMMAARLTRAQTIQVDVKDEALKESLARFSAEERIDIVFSERQVRGKRANCAYEGEILGDAFACLLSGQGLRAERVRRRQFVLASVSASSSREAETPRGMLRGFVVDAGSEEVLPGAHIYLQSLRIGATTNEAGYFALSSLPREDYSIRFSYLGYASKDTLLSAGAGPVRVQLRPINLRAEGIVVEAEQAEEYAVEPGIIHVPVHAIEDMPAVPGEADLLQALRWLPGVRKVGSGNGGLIVRGGEPDQNLYLLDGAPVYQPWHALSLISTFQPETFKDIRLYQGSFPAEHGGRLSAVLDAELKDGGNGPRGLASVGLLSGRFILESPLENGVSAMVSGRRSYLDQLLGTVHPVHDGGVRDTMRTGYYFYDASGKITWRPSQKHRISLSGYGGADVFDLRLPFDISLNFADWLKPSKLFFEVGTRWSNRLLNARYQYLYSSRMFLTATAYLSGYSARERIYVQPTVSSSITSDYNVDVLDVGLKVDADYYPSLAHQVRAGLRVVHRRFSSSLDALVRRSPGSTSLTDQESDQRAMELVMYVQDTWQPAPRWQIQPGLRASLLSGSSRLRIGPRLGLRYAAVNNRLILRAAVGAHVQYMHRMRDRYSLLYDLVSSRWIPASKSVDPSTSVHYSLGAVGLFVPGVSLTVDTYWHISERVLLPRDEFQTKDGLEGPGIALGTLLGQYTRGRARAYGLESTLQVERGPWRAWLSYAAGRSESLAPELGETQFRIVRYDVPQSFRGALRRAMRRWEFSLSALWRSGLPLTVPVARYAVGDPLSDEPTRFLSRPSINNGRLPPYLRFDVLVGHRFVIENVRVRIQAQVYNVTARRNIINRVFDPSVEDAVGIRNRRSLPAIPMLEITAEF